MKLPQPIVEGKVSVERAIMNRRTVRSYTSEPLTEQDLSQLLWAAQGTTMESGLKRAAPSAGALYPMDVYGVVGEDGVPGLSAGVYHYTPENHALQKVASGDLRRDAAREALSQTWMAGAPVNLVITAEYSRITRKYRERGIRYAVMEAGHIAQNIFLQAESLGLGAGIVGAFNDQGLIRTLSLPQSHEPLLIMPVGHA